MDGAHTRLGRFVQRRSKLQARISSVETDGVVGVPWQIMGQDGVEHARMVQTLGQCVEPMLIYDYGMIWDYTSQ